MRGILVVDDEADLVRSVRATLQRNGYEVALARSGAEALRAVEEQSPALVILDLGLPDLAGTEVIKRLRTWSSVPVIVLSGQESYAQKIAALDAGADDYVTKPFVPEELVARVRAVLRRGLGDEGAKPLLRFGDLEVDLNRRVVRLSGRELHLTPIERSLLEVFATSPGRLLSHRWLLQRVWGPEYGAESNYLRFYVGQLRAKLGDDAARPRFIATEPGSGYRWIPELS